LVAFVHKGCDEKAKKELDFPIAVIMSILIAPAGQAT
jgi:hypothetical protein